ncbi:MAG: efflux RND transporter periplasmic adaptor subunit [Cytophagales bacterium]|nr:efflux RND transporter periplasmic adaptor subunit [Cytophagales bacterium]
MKTINSFYILLLVAASACTSPTDQRSNEEPVVEAHSVHLTDEQIKTFNLQLGHIEEKVISSPLRVSGMLDVPPQNLVTIAAPMGGFVKHTELLQGMRVTQGQVVATLEHQDYIQLQQDYLDSKAQLDYLQLEYSRQQELAKENVNATKALQQAKSNYEAAKAREGGLRARLKLLNITPATLEADGIKSTINIVTPISGFVTEVNVNRGAFVNSTDAMFKIVDTDHLHAEAQVFEQDAGRLKIGQVVKIRLVNEPKERLASVHLIGKEISATRTVRVHCHLNEEDHTLIPGQYFTATIATDGAAVKAVPQDAVVSFEGENYLFFSKGNGSFGWTKVETGATQDDSIAITLPENFDLTLPVVIKGGYTLISILKNVAE